MNRSSGSHCAVHGCTYNRRKLKEALQRPCYEHFPSKRQDCGCAAPFSFHLIPSDPDIKKQWLAALRLKYPPKQIHVCSFHFIDKKPTKENPVPQLYMGYAKKVKIIRRELVDRAPEEVSSSTSQTPRGSARLESTPKRKSSSSTSDDVVPEKCQAVTEELTLTHTEDIKPLPPPACPRVREHMLHVGTQWEDPSLTVHWFHTEEVITFCKQTETDVTVTCRSIQCNMTDDETVASNLIKSDSDAKVYTGVSKHIFTTLVENCKPFANQAFRMHLADQILITLMKLKLNLLLADLARLFGVSISLVSTMISYWINVMASHRRKLNVWIPKEKIRATKLGAKLRRPNTTCVTDCADTSTFKNTKPLASSFTSTAQTLDDEK